MHTQKEVYRVSVYCLLWSTMVYGSCHLTRTLGVALRSSLKLSLFLADYANDDDKRREYTIKRNKHETAQQESKHSKLTINYTTKHCAISLFLYECSYAVASVPNDVASLDVQNTVQTDVMCLGNCDLIRARV